jgi:hypothetical protein
MLAKRSLSNLIQDEIGYMDILVVILGRIEYLVSNQVISFVLQFRNLRFGKKRHEKQCFSSFKFTIQASDKTNSALISSATDQSLAASEKQVSHKQLYLYLLTFN